MTTHSTTPGYFTRYENLAFERTDDGVLTMRFHTNGGPITENGPESPALSKAGMNGRSFRAGWVEGKHHSSLVLCSPQD